MFCPGEECDAYSLKGEAIIRQVVSKNESQLSPPPDPNDTFGIEEKPDCIVIAYPPPDWKDTDKFQLLRRRRLDKEVSMPCTRCNETCVNDQCYDRIDEQGPLRWEPDAGRHGARRAALWCMSVLRAWLPTHQPASTARIRCRCS
jgi:hypothetical protein